MTFRLRTLLPFLFAASAAEAAPMTLNDYLALTGPAPTATLAYGSAPSQFADLFRPAGQGPPPATSDPFPGTPWRLPARGGRSRKPQMPPVPEIKTPGYRANRLPEPDCQQHHYQYTGQ